MSTPKELISAEKWFQAMQTLPPFTTEDRMCYISAIQLNALEWVADQIQRKGFDETSGSWMDDLAEMQKCILSKIEELKKGKQ